jgi:hypothetical protein
VNAYKFEKVEDQYELIKEGEYEVAVKDIKLASTPSGKEKIAIQFQIRTDVEQEHKNRILFEDIWKEKENPMFFNRRRLNQLLGTQKIDDGTSFADVNSVLDFLRNATLVVKVTREFDEYRKADVNRILYYRSSKALAKKIEQAKARDVKDEDLPF